MADFDFDLFVIGGGSGGVRAARIAAEAGASVGLAEEYRYGGTCVIRGCVPKKLLVYASSFRDAFEDARGYGWTVEPPRFDWKALIAAKDAEIARLEAIYHANLQRAGRADLHGPRHPRRSPIPSRSPPAPSTGRSTSSSRPAAAPSCPTSPARSSASPRTRCSACAAQPKRLAIVGGGYVACEFAGIMNGLGTEVLQFYRGDQILRGFDDDLRDHVADAMRDRGVVLEIQRDVAGVEKAGDGLRIAPRQRREPCRRPGALRHRPQPQHRGPRPRGARRPPPRRRRGRGRPLVADRRALDLRRRRRHRRATR